MYSELSAMNQGELIISSAVDLVAREIQVSRVSTYRSKMI
jgi:hypothetical protein